MVADMDVMIAKVEMWWQPVLALMTFEINWSCLMETDVLRRLASHHGCGILELKSFDV